MSGCWKLRERERERKEGGEGLRNNDCDNLNKKGNRREWELAERDRMRKKESERNK